MATVHGPVLALGIDARGAQKAALDFAKALGEIADAGKQADAGTAKTSKGIQQLGVQAGQSAKLLELAKGVIASFGVGLGIAGLQQLAAGFTALSDASIKTSNAIKLSTSSASAAERVYGELFTAAQNSGASINTLAQVYQRLSIVGTSLGASQQELLQFTSGVADALRVAGISSTEAAGPLLQLSQAMGSGTVRAEEFNSVMEGLPIVLKAASKYIDDAGGDVNKLRQIMLAGNLGSKEFFQALLKGFQDISRDAKTMEKTTGAAMTALGNSVQNLASEIDKASGATSAWKSILEGMSSVFDDMAKAIAASNGSIKAQNELLTDFVAKRDQLIKQRSAFLESLGVGKETADTLSSAFTVGPFSDYAKRKQDEAKRQSDEALAAQVYNSQSDEVKLLELRRPKTILPVPRPEDFSKQQEALIVKGDRAEAAAQKKEAAEAKRQAARDAREAVADADEANRAIISYYKAIDDNVAQLQSERDALIDRVKRSPGARNEESIALINQAFAQRINEAEVEKIKTRAGELERFYQAVGDEIAAIEQERTAALADINLQKNLTPDQKSQLVTAVNRRYDAQSASAARAGPDYVTGLEVQAQGATARTSDEKTAARAAEIERQKQIELAGLDEVAIKYNLTEEQKQRAVEATTKIYDAQMKDLIDSTDTWAQFSTQAFSTLGAVAGDMFFSVLQGGKTSFQDLAASAVQSLARIALQMLAVKAIGAATTALGFGVPVAHTGWEVGGTEPVTRRTVSLDALAGARRYHTGLAADERVGIFQTGETIVPRGGSRGGGNNFVANVNVNVGSSGQGGGNGVNPEVMGRQIQASVKSAFKDLLAEESRPGGSIATGIRY